MNHRERVLAAMRHEPLDRVPTVMWATVEVQEMLFDHFGIETGRGVPSRGVGLFGGVLAREPQAIIELWDKLEIDGILALMPPYVGPPLKQDGDIVYSEWGFGSRVQKYDRGEYLEQIVFPLAEAETIEDLEAYQWPDPDWYDYDALREIAKQCDGRAIGGGYSAPFYYHNMLRGLEQSLMDPLRKPEFAHYLIQRISDFFYEYHRRLFDAVGDLIDVTQVTDDFGSQYGLMISPKIFNEFYRKPMQRGIDLAKEYDIIVFHHDDGDCRALLPTFVEMGVQVLNPIQWRCGDWDLAALKRDFGEHLCFHSAVDNQQTLPFGTPDDVRAEVKMLIETLASDGTGFIIGPCHNLQIVSPVENIIALYEAAHEYGVF